MSLVKSPSAIVDEAETSGKAGLLSRRTSWARVELGKLVNIQNGAAFSSSLFSNDQIGMPLIRIRDVGSNTPITYFSGDFDAAYIVEQGDLLIGMDGDFRLARWNGPRGLLNQRVCRLVVNSPDLDNRFLEYVLPGYLDAIWRETSAVTVKHLSSRTIAEIPIPLPPMDEQKRIVEILEEQLSRLDAGRDTLERTARMCRNLIKSSLQDCVSRAMKDSQTQLVSLGSIAKISSGATPLKSKSEFYKNGTIPWITSGDLAGGLIEVASHYVTETALRETSIKLVPAGSLLVAMYGEGKTRGTVAELGIECTTNQACASITFEPEFADQKAWVRLVLENNYQHLRTLASGGVQPNLNLGLIKALQVPLPEKAKRDKLLADHVKRSAQTDYTLAISEELLRRQKMLKRSLLNAAFTGQLTKESTSVR